MAQAISIQYQNDWTGYSNFSDPTNTPQSFITAGSQNVFIQDGAKLEPRAGIDYFGAPGTVGVNTNPTWTIAHRIHSSYDKFCNKQGVIIPLRVFYSGTTAQGDVMEAWLPIYSGGVATAAKQWYQMTTTVTPTNVLNSTHEYYFDEWWSQENLQSRVVFTIGINRIFNWTGGWAPVISLTPTTITTDTTWAEKGFVGPTEGNSLIIVNGVEYTVTSGFATNTITVASTAGISVDDIVFQSIDSDDTLGGTTIYDVCSTINNQVYYLDWKQRNVYISWNRSQIGSLGVTTFVGTSGLDDAVFGGTYTGTTTDTYQVSIDSVDPASETQTFTGTGINDIFFNTGGYTGGSGENIYTVSMVADAGFTFAGVPAIIPNPGDILTGSISNAIGRVTFLDGGGQDPALEMLTSQSFVPGDIISGTQGTPYGTVFSVVGVNWFQLFKNGVAITPTAYAPFIAYQMGFAFNPVLFVDGLSFSFQFEGGHQVGDFWTLTINSGGPDTFSWSLNGVNQASNVAITGGAQALSQGITVTFGATTGHDIGDTWTMIAFANIVRGWTNFTFTQPIRYPGEGFKLLLDSNGWTMKPQEKSMYINAQAGHYYSVQLELSSNLQSETLIIQRLKSEYQSKVLYPYLITYAKNDLVTISQDKTYDNLGRKPLLELPQTDSISDVIRVNFETADWENANVLYFKRKIFFSVPRTGLVFVWDDYKKYWHSPMQFARRIGNLAIIDDTLVGHSYERNESYELFTGLNDLEIYPINTKIVTPYDSFGTRYMEKACSAIGFEGYIEGLPNIQYRVNFDIGGCHGNATGIIKPFLCLPQDTAALGLSSLGHHGLGNDPVAVIPHFFYIKPFTSSQFYQRNIEITCNALDQRWSLISMGTDAGMANINNVSIVDPA